jgi:purine-nucleoside/S-methyl-5'-thioadenosine phosphorylase / adenosine deaminase
MIRWDAPEPYVVVFATRNGGVSAGPYSSLNLGLLTDDEPANVEENRRRLCDTVGADVGRLSMNRQVHGAAVHRARPGVRNRDGDGLWTDECRVPMLALTADCLPVAVARTRGQPGLALLHVGRIGLLGGVLAAGVATLDGGPTTAIVGPGIGPCCYEVGDGIRAAYRHRFGPWVARGRNLDLWAAVERALRDAGVRTVQRTDVCTACNPQEYFSHRRDGGVTGRQGVIGYVA